MFDWSVAWYWLPIAGFVCGIIGVMVMAVIASAVTRDGVMVDACDDSCNDLTVAYMSGYERGKEDGKKELSKMIRHQFNPN